MLITKRLVLNEHQSYSNKYYENLINPLYPEDSLFVYTMTSTVLTPKCSSVVKKKSLIKLVALGGGCEGEEPGQEEEIF
jgi:hypothetical protein